jgi:hypothetical protein
MSITEIVQFGASHSVLDLGNRTRMFEGKISNELNENRGVNTIVLFEDAGGIPQEKAMEISRVISESRSVLEAYVGLGVVDSTIVNILATGPKQEHSHNDMALMFFDWLLRKFPNFKRLSFIPEHYPTEAICEEIRKKTLRVGRFTLGGQSLDEIIESFGEEQRLIKEQVSARDELIAGSLEPLIAQSGSTRLKIIISIGSGHTGIEQALSPKIKERVKYETKDTFQPADVGEEMLIKAFESPARESVARAFLTGILIRNAKNIFLEKHKDKLIKELGSYDKDISFCQNLADIVSTLSEAAVYMLLQEWGAIDCGLSVDEYPQEPLPEPLDRNMLTVLANLEAMVETADVIDLSGSEIGVFIDQRFIAHSLYLMLNVSDFKTRQDIEKWLTVVSAEEFSKLKKELILYFEYQGKSPLPRLESLIQGLAYKKPDHVDRRTYLNLCRVFGG